MRTPLAWHNTIHDPARSAVAISGVAFALVLMFMQIGFLEAVLNTAVIALDKLDADIFLVSRHYLFFADAGTFPRSRLEQAASVPGVSRAVPLNVATTSWRVPETAPDMATAAATIDPEMLSQMHLRRAIMVLAFDPADRPFRRRGSFDPAEIDRHADALRQPDTLLIDRRSRKEFGPQTVGAIRELGTRPCTVLGRYEIGTGFAADGSVLVADQSFRRLFGPNALDRASVGLVRLAPGADPDAVAARLRRALPTGEDGDCLVYTRSELEWRERAMWVLEKPIGVIFFLGVVVAFVVGVVVVYQVLSSEITDHMGEYATLKAMGYDARFLKGVVTDQAMLLAFAGYVPGLAVSWLLYRLINARVGLPIEMNMVIMALVLVLSVAMCAVSALVSVRKVKSADPADLF